MIKCFLSKVLCLFFFGTFAIGLSGCVTLESVVEDNIDGVYNNTLIAIPCDKLARTCTFSRKLKKNLEKTFASENKKVEVLVIQLPKNELVLNQPNHAEGLITAALAKDHNDLFIYFRPTKLKYSDNALYSVTYQVVGTDVASGREVWKSNLTTTGMFGPSIFAKKTVNKLFQRLETDKVL